MRISKELPLQFFAEESGQTTGESTADAGQNQGEGQAESAAKRLSWQEIMADPEYKKQYDAQVQGIVQKRLRGRQGAEESLARLGPVLKALDRRYGGGNGDIRGMDMEELADSIICGVSRAQREEGQQRIMSHLQKLMEQEAELRESFPEFRLMDELNNPEFIKLTAPHTGLSLGDAYYALHRKEIGQAAAKDSIRAVVSAISSGASRPREHSGRQAASTITGDPKMMSKEQREALKKRIYQAKAQGKKLPYGG